jgi:hypothetical protein
MRKSTSAQLIALLLLCQLSCLSQECWAANQSKTKQAPPTTIRTVSDTAIKAAYSGEKYKKEVRKLNWRPDIGWNGLVIGKSTLSDAESKFGKAEPSFTGLGDRQYVFSAPIRMWIANSTQIIQGIEVYVSNQFVAQTPATVQDAQTMFGPLKQVDEVEGCTKTSSLRRPGLTVNARSMDKDAQVTTLFFNQE